MLGKLMENMTWIEIEEAIKTVPFVIIPLGAKQKEHGFHLPMNTDFILAEYFRDRILERYNVLSTSVIDINFFPAFTEYPGSEHISLETAVDLVYQKCKCHVIHGITHLYVINMGISTNKVLEKVQEKFRQESIVFGFSDQKKFDKSPVIKDISMQMRGTHADELETSMMLYIKPEVVIMQKAVKDDNDEIDPSNHGPLTRNQHAKSGIYSASGVWGDPTLASYEKGKIIVNEYIRLLETEIGSYLSDCLMRKEGDTLLNFKTTDL